jgi:cytochrome o ubiquinol oxidase subunit 2
MPQNRKAKGYNHVRAAWIALVVIAAIVSAIAWFMRGHNIALFHTGGWVASEQLRLMVITVGIMLVLGIPAVFLLYFTAWKYRESNRSAKREPEKQHNKFLDAAMWLVPGTVAVILASIMVPATHKLEPNKAIARGAKPMTIQVVALQWKWLFIYPEQNIATVNYVQMPVGTPVEFQLTADEAPMSAFWIPNLAGMLYAMSGHNNELNIVADKAGDYPGSTGEINGAGFADMKFTARASSQEDFDEWVQRIKHADGALDMAAYGKLVKPSEKNLPAYYSAVPEDLYGTVLMKYGPHGSHGKQEGDSQAEGHGGHH